MKKPRMIFLVLLVSLSGFAQKAIDTTQVLIIGGIKQLISLKGTDISHPILLFLCGGPGGSVMDAADGFTSQLQKKFVVVEWDQRETGKTLQLNKSTLPLTLTLMKNDTKELIDALLAEFKQQKLYLMAHSWGTELGFFIAGKYPDLLYAYIAISPMTDQSRSERMALAMLKEKATQTGNARELEELSKVQIPFANGEQLYFARKWLFSFSGQPIADRDTAAMKEYVASWAKTWLPVWSEAIGENHFNDLDKINCPVYFCAGRKDYQTNFAITEEYYHLLKAPKKELFWFEHSGHLIPNTEPDLLQDIVIQKILQ
jgi:pimeloyl-ACP methyl ester carboxylesterase